MYPPLRRSLPEGPRRRKDKMERLSTSAQMDDVLYQGHCQARLSAWLDRAGNIRSPRWRSGRKQDQ